MNREILCLCRVFTLEAQQFGWNSAPARKWLDLRQRPGRKLVAVKGWRRARRDCREKAIVVDQRQNRKFVERRFGFRAQILDSQLCAAIVAFPLADG